MNTGSIDKVENNKFAAADLEHELVMLGDDLKMEVLTQTCLLSTSPSNRDRLIYRMASYCCK